MMVKKMYMVLLMFIQKNKNNNGSNFKLAKVVLNFSFTLVMALGRINWS